jgi:hypothetical protein
MAKWFGKTYTSIPTIIITICLLMSPVTIWLGLSSVILHSLCGYVGNRVGGLTSLSSDSLLHLEHLGKDKHDDEIW